ncbi:hypothetical protein ACFC18_39230 [Streptomyces sp. NPDC056121]|uniref:hypothetical protein n=1 Tax=Streptomyces sp. NPDC056121 TaxID=3345718 RepID=UPI0035DB7EED
MTALLVVNSTAPDAQPYRAPLSRVDDAEVTPAPCQACGADVLHFGWVNKGGVGVLLHDGVDDSVPCPAAVPFDWETGKPLAASGQAVAA